MATKPYRYTVRWFTQHLYIHYLSHPSSPEPHKSRKLEPTSQIKQDLGWWMVSLRRWFLAGSRFLPQGMFGNVPRHFCLTTGEVLLAPSGWRPGMPHNIVQRTWQLPTTKNYRSNMSVVPRLKGDLAASTPGIINRYQAPILASLSTRLWVLWEKIRFVFQDFSYFKMGYLKVDSCSWKCKWMSIVEGLHAVDRPEEKPSSCCSDCASALA